MMGNMISDDYNKEINKEMENARRRLLVMLFALAVSLFVSMIANAQTPAQWKALKSDVVFYVANDLGRNGYYEQKKIAELMGVMGETVGPECVVAAGDIHHFNGVASVNDPLWITNYENIYSHPELMIDWWPVLGNHEYRGNTQAVIDYHGISRRWMMTQRYYTKVIEDKGTTIRLVFIDTTPMIEKYRKDNEVYPDAALQDVKAQTEWIDSVLASAHEDWVLIIGHHPVYAQTSKSDTERRDMQATLLPLIRKHRNVDMYVCGHIHNFQHIRMQGDDTDYVVNSSASLARNVKATEGTVFCSPEPGFSIVSANKQTLNLYMIDANGNVLHTVSRNK